MPATQIAATTPSEEPGQEPVRRIRGHALRSLFIDMVAPIAVYYGIRAAGGSIWLALIAGGAVTAAGVLAGLITRRGVDTMGLLVLAALAVSAAFSLVTGSPRALLARDGLLTAAWAGYMYVSLLARRPATFVISRPLLEGWRVFDQSSRRWVRPAARSWDDLWAEVPSFRHIWRVCTVIWGSAILADAVIRVVLAYTMPVNAVPALGGALWPVTFVVLQVITNVYFIQSGFWQILRDGGPAAAVATSTGTA
jgi:hypothetical protein